jgi:hypothetical protein
MSATPNKRPEKRSTSNDSPKNLNPGSAVVFQSNPPQKNVGIFDFNIFLSKNFTADVCSVRKVSSSSFLIFCLYSSDTEALLNTPITINIPGVAFTRRLGRKRPPNSTKPSNTPVTKQLHSIIVCNVPHEYDDAQLCEHIKLSHAEVYSARRIKSVKTQQATFVRVFASEAACDLLLNQGIKIGLLHLHTERPRSSLFATTPPQCTKCQRFGHSTI